MSTATLTSERKSVLQRRIRWIVFATIAYNVIEAIVALTAGSIASSAALIGFGLDSIVEVLSAAAVAWQFSRSDPERYEKPTLRVIAAAFFALAAYVTVSSGLSLAGAVEVQHSTVGIVLAAVSVIVMPGLSLLERRTGLELGSATAVADSKQTLICTYLSAAVLMGLVLNSTLGWSWADAVAGLVIAAFAIREGVEAWRGDTCATPIGMLLDVDHDDGEHDDGDHDDNDHDDNDDDDNDHDGIDPDRGSHDHAHHHAHGDDPAHAHDSHPRDRA